MWWSIVLLLVVSSRISSASVIHNQATADFRSHLQNHAEFGESIKQWFNNIRNRIFGRPAPPENRELFDLSRAELLQRVDDPRSFFLDLSRLTFDPDYDWGFHIGHWYFIRRGDRNYGGDNFNDWHFLPVENSDEFVITPEYVTTEEIGNNPETTMSVPENSEELITLEPEVPESDASVENTDQEKENDNETGSVFTYTQSAEIVR